MFNHHAALPPSSPSSACSLPAGNSSLPSASDGGHEKLTLHAQREEREREKETLGWEGSELEDQLDKPGAEGLAQTDN